MSEHEKEIIFNVTQTLYGGIEELINIMSFGKSAEDIAAFCSEKGFDNLKSMSFIIEDISCDEIERRLRKKYKKMYKFSVSSGNFSILTDEYFVAIKTSRACSMRAIVIYVHCYGDATEKLYKIRNIFADIIVERADTVQAVVDWIQAGTHGLDCTEVSTLIDDVVLPEAYPYITDIDAFAENYMKSSATVLILIGPQGTGKTRFVRHVVKTIAMKYNRKVDDSHSHHVRSSVEHRNDNNGNMPQTKILYTTDTKAMSQDQLYIDFVSGEYDFLLFEDIDNLLVSRREGNEIMHKFLSSSDGFLTNKAKIIFTTNLDISDIDEALLRRGRCFAVINTRNLSKEEALKLYFSLGGENPTEEKFKDGMSVADVYGCLNEPTDWSNAGKRSIGFKHSY